MASHVRCKVVFGGDQGSSNGFETEGGAHTSLRQGGTLRQRPPVFQQSCIRKRGGWSGSAILASTKEGGYNRWELPGITELSLHSETGEGMMLKQC